MSGADPPKSLDRGLNLDIARSCQTCGASLARDNRSTRCGPCSHSGRHVAPEQPHEFWHGPAIAEAIASHHIGKLIYAYRNTFAPRVTQAVVGEWLQVTQNQVSVIERGRPVRDLEKLNGWCDALRVPQHLRWFRAGPSAASADDLASVGLVYSSSLSATLKTIEELGRQGVDRRTYLRSAVFIVTASVAPSRDWLLATLDEVRSARGRVGFGQVDAIRRTFRAFQELDVMRGGGYAFHRLNAYVNETVLPLLHDNDPETNTGEALFGAAAEQLYLLGWMAFDDGEHAMAQRYLIQAMRLAQASHRPELGAHVHAGLADQATLTGNPDQGLQLARAGRHGLERGHSPACLADLWALQARAEAAMGQSQKASVSVMASQRAFDAVVPDDEPEWARFIDAAYLNGEHANTFRDLRRPRESAHFAQISADEAQHQRRARRGSLAQAAIARAALDDHDLAAAAAAALETVKLAASVQSSRSIDAVVDLRDRMQRHDRSAAIRDFLEISRTLLAV
jgi:hypothetical protein